MLGAGTGSEVQAGRIRVLPATVANQIAAGEVVERPVSVVKELVENALDAGASEITVEVRDGGKQLLRVTDNGGGMTPEEAKLALLRHGTSKLHRVEDLLAVGTFGFRGEALPSIASVSRFRLQTRTAEATEGIELTVAAGEAQQERVWGGLVGTCVEVGHLFHGVPARRKFLRSEATETAHITQLLRLLALAHPAVAFRLEVDGRETLRSPVCRGLADRVGELFGFERRETLWPVAAEETGLHLEGLISPPGEGRANRQELAIFVNRRPVQSPMLLAALREAYQGKLPKGRYPAAFLFLRVPPEAVDVNVHPAKREVRFRDGYGLRRFFLEALLAVLEADRWEHPGRRVAENTVEGARQKREAGEIRGPEGRERKKDPGAGSLEGASAESPTVSEVREARTPFRVAGPRGLDRPVGPGAFSQSWSGDAGLPRGWRYVGPFRSWGELFERTEGLVLLRVPSARQRILFEQIVTELEAGAAAAQPLLLPETVELSGAASAVAARETVFWEDAGFAVESFGGSTWRLTSGPAYLREQSAGAFWRSLVEAVAAGELTPRRGAAARRELAQRAAAEAARSGSLARETPPEVLLARLLSCREPLVDPFGRPTCKAWDEAELRRHFRPSGEKDNEF